MGKQPKRERDVLLNGSQTETLGVFLITTEKERTARVNLAQLPLCVQTNVQVRIYTQKW